jgi:hypothetical protein
LYFPKLSFSARKFTVFCSSNQKEYCYFLEFLVVFLEFFVCIAILYFLYWVM